jgi:hypothetical protein
MLRSIHWKYFVILFCINFFLAWYATPITDFGDSGNNIVLSKKCFGDIIGAASLGRSPLLPLILALLIRLLGIPYAFKAAVCFQYLLVFFSSLLIISIFQRLFRNTFFPFIISLAFNLSFATIFYANILLGEILAVFLLLVSITFLFKYDKVRQIKYILCLGSSLGLLSLARFNAVPIIGSFFIILLYLLFLDIKITSTKRLFLILVFIVSFSLIVFSWALCNYSKNNMFGMLHMNGSFVSRNAIVASIRTDNKVSEPYKPILDIFLKAKNKYKSESPPMSEGSLRNNDSIGILYDLYSGYQVYQLAEPDLVNYLHSANSISSSKKSIRLAVFYREIQDQNYKFIWKLRFYSFLNSLRPSAGGFLPKNYGKINLNVLPSFLIKFYKLIVPFVSFFVLFFGLYFFFKVIFFHIKPNFILLSLFFIVFSFWGINFLFVTESNANRYKFPVEPLIFGLFIVYVHQIVIEIIKTRKTTCKISSKDKLK